MPSRKYNIEGIGLVSITKRRGNTNLRLSIKPNGTIALSMPYWAPFALGERFIKSRQAWISQQLKKIPLAILREGDLVGKNHRLRFIEGPGLKSRVTETEIIITTLYSRTNNLVQKKVLEASEVALKKESEKLIALRVQQLSAKYRAHYKKIRFRKLASRWGSCSTDGTITLNIYLIQLPWELIDYVITHELAHLKHMNHSREFWNHMEELLPKAKQLRRAMKLYNPVIMTDGAFSVA